MPSTLGCSRLCCRIASRNAACPAGIETATCCAGSRCVDSTVSKVDVGAASGYAQVRKRIMVSAAAAPKQHVDCPRWTARCADGTCCAASRCVDITVINFDDGAAGGLAEARKQIIVSAAAAPKQHVDCRRWTARCADGYSVRRLSLHLHMDHEAEAQHNPEHSKKFVVNAVCKLKDAWARDLIFGQARPQNGGSCDNDVSVVTALTVFFSHFDPPWHSVDCKERFDVVARWPQHAPMDNWHAQGDDVQSAVTISSDGGERGEAADWRSKPAWQTDNIPVSTGSFLLGLFENPL